MGHAINEEFHTNKIAGIIMNAHYFAIHNIGHQRSTLQVTLSLLNV